MGRLQLQLQLPISKSKRGVGKVTQTYRFSYKDLADLQEGTAKQTKGLILRVSSLTLGIPGRILLLQIIMAADVHAHGTAHVLSRLSPRNSKNSICTCSETGRNNANPYWGGGPVLTKLPGGIKRGVSGSEVGPTHRVWCAGGAHLSKMTEANCHVRMQIKQHKIVFRIGISLLKAV